MRVRQFIMHMRPAGQRRAPSLNCGIRRQRTTMDALSRLGYPEVWRTMDLYPDKLRIAQEAELIREPLGEVGGTEHFRYGAFCFWLGIRRHRNPYFAP